MSDGLMMMSSDDLSAYQNAMDVGGAGFEVITLPTPKTTTQTKQETIAVRANKRENERELQKTLIALEATNIKRQFLCVVIFGILMTLVTLALVCIAFGTPEWRVYEVDQRFNPNLNPGIFPCQKDSRVSTCQFQHSRKRGMFATCYSKPAFLKKLYPSSTMTFPYIGGSECVWEQKYNIQGTPIVVLNNCGQDPLETDASSLVDLNTNLMRAHWMCFALAIVFLLDALVLSLVSFKCIRVLGLMLAALSVLMATLLLIAGMGLFHGYTHLEENKLTCPPFYATMRKSLYKNLYDNTLIRFGFSFWMGWISVCTGVVACSFLLVAACKRRSSMRVINKALNRLRDLNKDEKMDKKYELVQERISRKETENEIKMKEKDLKRMSQMQTARMEQAVMFNPRISDSQFNYKKVDDDRVILEKLAMEREAMEAKYAQFEEKSQMRLTKIEEKMKKELNTEKKKLEFEKMRVIEEAKRREERPEKSKKRGWFARFMNRNEKEYYSDDDSCDHEDDRKYVDRGYNNRSYDRRSSNSDCKDRCSALPAIPGGICNDPYTLHLPTGTNRY